MISVSGETGITQKNDSRLLSGFRPYLFIIILGLLLYGRTLFFDFTYLDDNALILENYPVLSSVQNIGQVFGSDVFFSPIGERSYYRPLLNVSLMADAAVAGPLPTIFHLSNILLHLLAAALIFLALKKLRYPPALSFGLTLLFLVHPVLTQAVAWIPGRNDSLLTVFVLSSFLSWLSFSDHPRLRSYLGYLIFLFFALLTKETAVFFPLLLIFYSLFLAPGQIKVSDRWLLAAGSLTAGWLWLLMRGLALGPATTGLLAQAESALKNSAALLIYLGKLLLPVNQSVFPVLADSPLFYGGLAVLILAIVWLWARRTGRLRTRYLLFGLFWFLIFLWPTFIRPNGWPDFLEHRVYLSFFGFLIWLGEIALAKNLDFSRRSVKITVVIVLAIYAGLVFHHSGDFSNRLIFWQAAAAGSPHSPLVLRNLGAMHYLDGQTEEAAKDYRAALALNPTEPMAHNNLGLIYFEQKDFVSAEQEFRAELANYPRYDKALFNLGNLYFSQRKWSEAAQFLQTALAVNPGYREAYERLLILANRLR